MADAEARCDVADKNLKSSQQDVARLNAEVERLRGVDDECARLRAELLAERKARQDVERELEHAGLLDTPRPFNATAQPISNVARIHAKNRGLGFRSIDSESSFTDVDSVDDNYGPELKAVEEVDEDDDTTDDDDDELSRYEDEEEDDEYAFPTSSSYNSVLDFSRSATPRLSTSSDDSAPALSISRSPSESPSPLPSPSAPTHAHARHASLSKAWTFPSGPAAVSVDRSPEEIDRFFGCLEDVDNSPPIDSKLHSVESHKNLFAQALAEYDDDLPPFVLPSDVGEIVLSPEMEAPERSLDVVVEEDEEEDEETDEEETEPVDDESYDHNHEFVGEVDEGGIKFTFSPPPSYFVESESDADMSTPDLTMSTPESSNKSGYVFEPIDEDESDSSFTFPQLKSQRNSPSPSGIPRLRSPSPSMIPVASSPKSSPPALRLITSSPSSPSFSTPPRRASTTPTFIPQPRGSPSPSPKVASFIPQPSRAHTSPRPSAIPVMMTPPGSSRLPYSAHLSSMSMSNSFMRSAVYSRRGL